MFEEAYEIDYLKNIFQDSVSLLKSHATLLIFDQTNTSFLDSKLVV